jgi:tetratricopeptide (TPR) repeat protein
MLIRLFLSIVSSEFRSYRQIMRTAMQQLNLSVNTTEPFIASGMPLIELMNNYLTSCDAVVHLVGEHTGGLVSLPALAWLRQQYPNLAQEFPVLRSLLSGEDPSSYVQWEAYLSLIHSKTLFVAIPTAGAIRDEEWPPGPNDAHYQAAHLARLRALGYYVQITFRSPEQLVANLVTSQLFDLVAAAGTQAQQAPTQPPGPQNLPYASLGSLFKGRGETMRRLRERFSSEKSYKAALALHGLGGIGKTRLAVEYAWQYQQDYSALLFVRADTPANLEANLAALCETPVLNLPEQSVLQQVRLQAVLDWLAQHPNWLLILDNIDTLEAAHAVEHYLPQLSSGQVLLTTRISEWSRRVERLQLDVLPRLDAAEFLLDHTLQERATTPTDAADALALADELGEMALALNIAGAYINSRHITLAAYRERWATSQQGIRQWLDKKLVDYPLSVATTWTLTFNPLRPDAQTVLNRLAWIAAAPIPLTLLGIAVPATEPLDAEEALDELVRYSLASYVRDGLSFSIHPLVQRVAREQLGPEARQMTFAEMLSWLDAAFVGSPQDVRTWTIQEPLRPHVMEITQQHAPEFDNPMPTGRLLNQLGQLLDAKAELGEAEYLMRQALTITEANFGPESPSVATCLNNLGELLRATNRLAEAEPLYRRALLINETRYGSNDPTVAIGLNNLALLLRTTNRLAEAESLYRRALLINEASYGLHHPTVAVCLNNLAGLLKTTNRLKDSEPLYHRALSIDQANYGPHHPTVATSLNNLAGILKDTNRIEEAELFYRRALAINEASFGPAHPSVATDLNNLAALLKVTNRMAEAEPLYRRALAIDEDAYGLDHPIVATDYNNLAGLLWATNRLAEAEQLLRRALAITEANYDRSHSTVALLLNNLAGLLYTSNRIAEAEALFYRAISTLTELQSYTGHTHPYLKSATRNYISLLRKLGRSPAAIFEALQGLGLQSSVADDEADKIT